jgi:hypothetical protein
MTVISPKKLPSDHVTIPCPRLAIDTIPGWDRAPAVFASSPVLTLGQAWNRQPDTRFRPAQVRTGWTGTALLVCATLEDDDIFNPVTEFNAPSFEHGDVFEMFLRPMPCERYYEFHVTPGNQKFQLQIPSAAEFTAARGLDGLPPDFFISDRVLHTAVRVLPDEQRWEVLAEIPFEFVGATSRDGTPERWLVSFSRYDYTRDNADPVLSSTSAHRQVDFHRQQEWRELVFNADP